MNQEERIESVGRIWVAETSHENDCGLFSTEEAAWAHFNSCQACEWLSVFSGVGEMQGELVVYVPDYWPLAKRPNGETDWSPKGFDYGGKRRWVNEYTGKTSDPTVYSASTSLLTTTSSEHQEVSHGESGVEGSTPP